MNEGKWHGCGLAILADDRRAGGHQHLQPQLFAYCAVSGVLGTVIATVLSLAASGATRIAIWAAALALVSLMAGLAYGSGSVSFLWSVCQPSRRQHPGS